MRPTGRGCMDFVNSIIHGDCLSVMKEWPDDCVDLVFGSPPYEDARTYGIDFNLKGQAWVDWMVEVVVESLRICKGLVAFVVEGKTKKFRWTATPSLLMADLHRAGVRLRKPPVFHRHGIPGSGGPDWLRNDYEFIVCATNGGKLLWSDNRAMGHPPKWGAGGEMSHRVSNGKRVNQWGGSIKTDSGPRKKDGSRGTNIRPSHYIPTKKGSPRRRNGDREQQEYKPPAISNPGNVIKCKVGGGLMGSPLAHENEAPFPEKLAEFFIKSFCPPGGVVCDPFSGSGTTASVAIKNDRKWVAVDVRQSQVDLTKKRLCEKAVVETGVEQLAGQRSLFE